jgi:hypothetical protein
MPRSSVLSDITFDDPLPPWGRGDEGSEPGEGVRKDHDGRELCGRDKRISNLRKEKGRLRSSPVPQGQTLAEGRPNPR